MLFRSSGCGCGRGGPGSARGRRSASAPVRLCRCCWAGRRALSCCVASETSRNARSRRPETTTSLRSARCSRVCASRAQGGERQANRGARSARAASEVFTGWGRREDPPQQRRRGSCRGRCTTQGRRRACSSAASRTTCGTARGCAQSCSSAGRRRSLHSAGGSAHARPRAPRPGPRSPGFSMHSTERLSGLRSFAHPFSAFVSSPPVRTLTTACS